MWGTLLTLSAGIALLLIVLPIVALVWRGITRGIAEPLPAGLFDAINLSMLTTAISLGLSLVFGTPLALLLAKRQFPLRRLVNLLVELPIVLPPAVAGLALLVAFGREGLLGGVLRQAGIALPFTTAAVIVAQTFVAIPFYVRTAVIGFQSIPANLEDAARVDGADERTLFLFITLPLASRALLAGAVLCWARALGEFGATLIFAGNQQGLTQTLPLLTYQILERDVDAAILTGGILLLLALIAVSLSRWVAPTRPTV